MRRSSRNAISLTLATPFLLAACVARTASTTDGDAGATAAPAAAALAVAASPSDTARDARIARILGGLRPSVEVTNRPLVRWTLAERMAHYEVPGVSIAAIEGGRVAWARGVGVKQAGGADPVTPATLFQAASISKPIAQTAMLRLVEQGKLALDTNVNVYLTSWKVPDNEHTTVEKVTLRRIASHSAGLTVHGFPGYADGAAVPTVPQLLDGVAPANTTPVRVDTTPGAITRYSGGGTTVMQQVLVDATGRPFPELMRELVLVPARMTHSTYEQPLPATRAGEAARAHRRDGTPIPGGWHTYPEMAAAGLWTTPTDLATWALAIADARAGRSSALLSTAAATAMLTEQKEGSSVGIGPSLSGSGRTFGFGHGGANAGFHSALIYYPELGTGAAVMTNGDGGPALLREVMAAMAAEYDWPGYRSRAIAAATLDSAAMSGMAGKYTIKLGPGLAGEITIEEGRLVLRAQRLQVQELIPQSPTQFTMSATGWKVEVARDASGRATGFTVDQGGGTKVEAVRAP
jgi:CubicO group peptidase (beta-lactamase class C family)